MGKEIERKFLTISDEWRENAKGILYVQGYLSTDVSRVVRVRIAGDQGYITIKGAAQGIARDEYEYKIPQEDARRMLDTLCLPGVIEKLRYKIPYGGLTWEVDEFKGANAGLIVAEVEVPSADHAVALPSWVGAEVSADPRYSNAALSQKPYSQWKQDTKQCHMSKH